MSLYLMYKEQYINIVSGWLDIPVQMTFAADVLNDLFTYYYVWQAWTVHLDMRNLMYLLTRMVNSAFMLLLYLNTPSLL